MPLKKYAYFCLKERHPSGNVQLRSVSLFGENWAPCYFKSVPPGKNLKQFSHSHCKWWRIKNVGTNFQEIFKTALYLSLLRGGLDSESCDFKWQDDTRKIKQREKYKKHFIFEISIVLYFWIPIPIYDPTISAILVFIKKSMNYNKLFLINDPAFPCNVMFVHQFQKCR